MNYTCVIEYKNLPLTVTAEIVRNNSGWSIKSEHNLLIKRKIYDTFMTQESRKFIETPNS